MVFTSIIPSFPVPKTDLLRFLFAKDVPGIKYDDDKPMFIDTVTGEFITVRQMEDLIPRLVTGFKEEYGLERGDVVAICSPNMFDYPLVMFGIIGFGGSATLANPTYTPGELAYQLEETKAKVLIAHSSNIDNALAAAKQVGLPPQNVLVFGKEVVQGVRPYRSVLVKERKTAPVVLSEQEAKETTAFLCFSSGTTGKSKGVMTTHSNIVSNVEQYLKIGSDHHSDPEAKILGSLPFFHIFGLNLCIHAALRARTPVYVMQRFDLVQFCELIQKHRITFSLIVPPIVVLLAKHPLIEKYDMSSIKFIISGAAPLDAELIRAVRARIPGVLIKQGYGLTETSPVATLHPSNAVTDGSCGILLPNMEAKVVNTDGKEVGYNERGELWLKGPNIMKGYLNRPKETSDVIDADGFFHTGDVVVVDNNNQFYVVDRLKELIKYKGFQVAPAELEAILLKSPSVADCAVIGVYDSEQATELPRAYVVLSPNVPSTDATAKEIQAFVAGQVAHYKQIHSVVFRDVIPKSQTGKILRNVLRAEVAKELELAKKSKL